MTFEINKHSSLIDATLAGTVDVSCPTVWQSASNKAVVVSGGKFGAPCTYHEQVVEQIDLALVRGELLALGHIADFVQATVAHEPSVRRGERELLADEALLEFADLTDVIMVGTELFGANPLVDAG